MLFSIRLNILDAKLINRNEAEKFIYTTKKNRLLSGDGLH